MSHLVTMYLSKPGQHKDGVLHGRPEAVRVASDTNLAGEVWYDMTFVIQGYKRKDYLVGKGRLLVVVTLASIRLLECAEGEDPAALTSEAEEIPVLENDVTSYIKYLHPDTKRIFVQMPVPPDTEPTRPWWLAWWPF